MTGGWCGYEIVVRIVRKEFCGWFRIWQFAALDAASLNGQHDDLPHLDAIIGPQAVGLAENIRVAVVFDHDSS